jgi:hypothetical protein
MQPIHKELYALGTEPRNRAEIQQLAGEFARKFMMQWEFSGLDEGSYISGKIGTDPWNFIDLLRGHFRNRNRLIMNGTGGVMIGAHAKETLTRELKHIADLIKDLRDFIVLHEIVFTSRIAAEGGFGAKPARTSRDRYPQELLNVLQIHHRTALSRETRLADSGKRRSQTVGTKLGMMTGTFLAPDFTCNVV